MLRRSMPMASASSSKVKKGTVILVDYEGEWLLRMFIRYSTEMDAVGFCSGAGVNCNDIVYVPADSCKIYETEVQIDG